MQLLLPVRTAVPDTEEAIKQTRLQACRLFARLANTDDRIREGRQVTPAFVRALCAHFGHASSLGRSRHNDHSAQQQAPGSDAPSKCRTCQFQGVQRPLREDFLGHASRGAKRATAGAPICCLSIALSRPPMISCYLRESAGEENDGWFAW